MIKIFDTLPGYDRLLIVRDELESKSLYYMVDLDDISLDDIEYERPRMTHNQFHLIMEFKSDEDFTKMKEIYAELFI